MEPATLDVTPPPLPQARSDEQPYSDVDLSTAEPVDGPSILSPAATYDISVIGVFLGGGLALALVVNHMGRAFSLSQALTGSLAVVTAAFRGVRGAQGNDAAAPQVAGAAGPDEQGAMTNTSNGTASFVFTSPAGPGAGSQQ